MIRTSHPTAPGGPAARSLWVPRSGLGRNPRVRRILELSGWTLTNSEHRADAFAAWGLKESGRRARQFAAATGKPLLSIEDGFLRSVGLGVDGVPPISLTIDPQGVYYDASRPSALEALLQTEDLSDPDLLARAGRLRARLSTERVTKYNVMPDPWPEGMPRSGYVLVIDQTFGDHSVTMGNADSRTFGAMLEAALSENPGAPVLLKTHPDVIRGKRRGNLELKDLAAVDRLHVCGANLDPWAMIEGADRIYTVTSQMGFEAMLAGREVEVFGTPFYAGWGLTRDRQAITRRTAVRSLDEFVAAALIRFPTYYDPLEDALCDVETAVDRLVLWRERYRENRAPSFCVGMSPWKRPTIVAALRAGSDVPRFVGSPVRAARLAREAGGRVVAWASTASPELKDVCAREGVPLFLAEDGFIRSRGLGAELAPAGSIVIDDVGIYYDPTVPSRLELMIEEGGFGPDQLERARSLVRRITEAGVTKYNVGSEHAHPIPSDGRPVILVPGQVEDDASIRTGSVDVRTNLDLLATTRRENPDAFIVFKPHPDVESGNRIGIVPDEVARRYADLIAKDASAAALLRHVDEVWTITSLMGLEALIFGKRVVALGRPFYAGWGLTLDRHPIARRTRRATLEEVVAAAYLLYPRYMDPDTQLPCDAEFLIRRLAGPGKRHSKKSWLARRLNEARIVLKSATGQW